MGPKKGMPATSRVVSSWFVKTMHIAYNTLGLPPPSEIKAHSKLERSWWMDVWMKVWEVAVLLLCRLAVDQVKMIAKMMAL